MRKVAIKYGLNYYGNLFHDTTLLPYFILSKVLVLKQVPRSFFGQVDRIQERTNAVVQMRTRAPNVLPPIIKSVVALDKLVTCTKGRSFFPYFVKFHVLKGR